MRTGSLRMSAWYGYRDSWVVQTSAVIRDAIIRRVESGFDVFITSEGPGVFAAFNGRL